MSRLISKSPYMNRLCVDCKERIGNKARHYLGKNEQGEDTFIDHKCFLKRNKS